MPSDCGNEFRPDRVGNLSELRRRSRSYFSNQRCSVLNPWIALGFQTIQLGMEMQSVIALRLMRLAAGGASGRTEASRMIAEKIAAAGEAQMAAASAVMTGRPDNVVAGKVLRVLRKRVRANKRRLSPKGRRRRARS